MPPFGFGKKEQPQSSTTGITDKEDLEEIKEIAEMLNPNEELKCWSAEGSWKFISMNASLDTTSSSL